MIVSMLPIPDAMHATMVSCVVEFERRLECRGMFLLTLSILLALPSQFRPCLRVHLLQSPRHFGVEIRSRGSPTHGTLCFEFRNRVESNGFFIHIYYRHVLSDRNIRPMRHAGFAHCVVAAGCLASELAILLRKRTGVMGVVMCC